MNPDQDEISTRGESPTCHRNTFQWGNRTYLQHFCSLDDIHLKFLRWDQVAVGSEESGRVAFGSRHPLGSNPFS